MRRRKRERERKIDWCVSCCKCERTQCGQQAPTWPTLWPLPDFIVCYTPPCSVFDTCPGSLRYSSNMLGTLPASGLLRLLFSLIKEHFFQILLGLLLTAFISLLKRPSLITLHKVSAHILRAAVLQDSKEWHSHYSPHELWPLGRVEQGTARRAKHSGLSITLSPPALLFFIVFNATWTSFLVNFFVSLIPSVMTASLSSDFVCLVYYYVSRD